MKIRKGFVSNSSSSSFVCDVSGYIESGWDMGLYEAGMITCENGHCFLEQYFIGDFYEYEIKIEDETGDSWEARYGVPAMYCPICSFGAVSDTDLINYLLKAHGKGREELRKEIKERFVDYKSFRKFIKG